MQPGGVFCNLEHIASPNERIHQRFLDALGITAEDPSNKLLDVETQLCWLRAIGFQDVDCFWKWRELHGWKSVPGGVKPTYIKDHGHKVLNPALPHDDFAEAVRIGQTEFDKHQPQVVAGSSRGGAVAMNIESGAAKLVLLCPAWRKYGTDSAGGEVRREIAEKVTAIR